MAKSKSITKDQGVTVTARGDRWRVQVRQTGRPPWSGTFATFNEAREAGLRQLHGDNPLPNAEQHRVTLKPLLESWKTERTTTNHPELAAITLEVEALRINRLVDDPIAALRVAEIDDDTIAVHVRRWRANGLAPNSIRLYLDTVRQAVGFFKRRLKREGGWVPVLPKNASLGVRPEDRTRRLEPGEEHRLLDAAAAAGDLRMLAAILTSLDSSARESEIAAIERKHVLRNQETGQPMLFIPRGVTARDKDRYAPLSERAVAALERLPDHESGRFFQRRTRTAKSARA